MTVRAVLFGDADPSVVLGRSATWGGVLDGLGGLSHLSPTGRAGVRKKLGSALAGLLELDLGQLIVGGWRRHRALRAAAQHTAADPAATELVQLAAHRIVTGHRPYLEVVVNEAVAATVHLELGLTVDIDTAVATVRQGRLVAIQSGRGTVTVSLSCQGRELASRQVVIDIAATVRLGHGIALLDEPPRATLPGATAVLPSQPTP